MWAKYCVIAIVIVVVGTSAALTQRQDDAPIPFVFTQSIESGAFDGGVLSVAGAGAATPYLSDGPERTLQGETENQELVKAWNAPGGSGVPATLDLGDGTAVSLRLMSAEFDGDRFRYAVETEGTIPGQFGPATLAIELNGCITGCSDVCPFNFSRVFFNKLVPCTP